MDKQAILEELLALLEQNGISVRKADMDGRGGGLCKLKGRKVFFYDTSAASDEVASACAQAVADSINIESLYIRPQVRDFLEENH